MMVVLCARITRSKIACLSLAVVILTLAINTALAATASRVVVKLDGALPGSYKIIQDGTLNIIQMDSFAMSSSPGEPILPHKVQDILLPPDALMSTVKLNIVSVQKRTIDGTYNIKAAGPDVAWVDGKSVKTWNDKNIVDGKNVDVYQSDVDFPNRPVKLLPCSQMRKWQFARIDFSPFQYNPVSKKLTVTESMEIEISYSTSSASLGASLMRDTVWEDIAASHFFNYTEAKNWYDQTMPTDQPSQTYDYVIITTNAINTGSTKLSAFVTHKQNLGHSVLVVIYENSIQSLTGQAPNNRAEKIRQWLINNYATMGIQYVLLIGDPCPYESGEGDIPMKMCYPRGTSNDDNDNQRAPTDYFYADLTGNWDIDTDQFYGEWDPDGNGTMFSGDYPVTGGVDFTPEVYVGRIPVYDANYVSLDSILQKLIDYQSASGDLSWRTSVLLPMGFQDSGYDGARLAEQMRNFYLLPIGYSSWRMYQQGTAYPADDSIYTSEEELRGNPATPNLLNRWTGAGTPAVPNDFGIVCWWAHGSATSTSVGYSPNWDGTLMNSSYTSSLDDDHPAFTYQCSCTNGHPETGNNLQYAILEHGGIGTVGATRVSWFNTGVEYGQFNGSTTNSGIGYEYVSRLVQNLGAGDALYNTKSSMSPESETRLMNWYVFNLYGDPSLAIGVDEVIQVKVDVNAPGNNDGSSWYNAYNYLQDALADPFASVILVADGTHYPDSNSANPGGSGNRNASFVLRNGVAIYGGYAGYGAPDPNDRDIELYETILSGDLDGNDIDVNNPCDLITEPTRAENSYHVVTGSFTDVTAILDGFTIIAGNANGAVWPDYEGAGMLNDNANCTVNKCTFVENSASGGGGGMWNGNGSNLQISNCIFYRNAGTWGGGGITNVVSSPTLVNCNFTTNKGCITGSNGGALYNISLCETTVMNCSFNNNSAGYGGAVSNIHSSCPNITNSTFSGNWAIAACGGINDYNNSCPTIDNCILWDNTAPQIGDGLTSAATVNYSDVQGGWSGAGVGNINADPMFVDTNDLHLLLDSPCIDTGENSKVPPGFTTDLDGRSRFVDGDCNDTVIVDMGAFEFAYAYIGDFDGQCDVDFVDFAIMAYYWLQNEPLVDIAPPPAGDSIVDMKDLGILCGNWLASAE